MATEKRLIDANALISILEEIAEEDESMYFHLDEITQEIFDTPTVDAVEVVHGEWVEETIYDKIICDVCGHEWNILDNDTETFNYCPNCGAKMDGDGNA